MLTQRRIQELIEIPKTIVGKRPSRGYREESGNRRCDLELRSDGPSGSTQPQERDRTVTSLYATLDQALLVFFADTHVLNHVEYFAPLKQLEFLMNLSSVREALRGRMAAGFDIYTRREGGYQLIVPICHEDGDMVDMCLHDSPRGEGTSASATSAWR